MDWHVFGLGIVGNLIAAVLVVIAGIIIAWLRANDWRWTTPIMYGLVTTAAILYIGSYILSAYSFITQGNLNSPQRIEERLKDWLYKGGYSVVPGPTEGNTFSIVARTGGNPKYPIHIFMEKKNETKRIITLLSSIHIDPPHQTAFTNLTQEERNKFIGMVKIELLKFGISYLNVGEPLEQIYLTELVFYDSTIKESEFLQRVFFVHRASALIRELIKSLTPG